MDVLSFRLLFDEYKVLHKALDCLIAGPALALSDASLRASGSERRQAERLLLELEDEFDRARGLPPRVRTP
jgi:hypothetical protein